MQKFLLQQSYKFQFLIETIRPFYEKYGCSKMVLNKCDKRLLTLRVISLNRYTPKDVYCSSLNTTADGIKIHKYDFAANDWNEFKRISFCSQRQNFGSIVVNGELFVLGGLNTGCRVSARK